MKFSSFLKGGTEILVTVVGGNSSCLWISIQFQELPAGENDTFLSWLLLSLFFV